MDSIWLYYPEKYSGIENESRKYILYPKIIEIINNTVVSKLLDYGCGDGSLLKFVSETINISIYDISSKILKVAAKNLVGREITIFHNREQIPINNFEIVVFSLVMMTISSKELILDELNTINELLTNNGKVVIAVTHPCFRQYSFSSFYTSYMDEEKFNYVNEGIKFKVTLHDPLNNNNISFYDYHWTMASTLNLIVKAGFDIEEVVELPDKTCEQSYFNKGIPPYLLIVGRKKMPCNKG